jgi:hypothetical protein
VRGSFKALYHRSFFEGQAEGMRSDNKAQPSTKEIQALVYQKFGHPSTA